MFLKFPLCLTIQIKRANSLTYYCAPRFLRKQLDFIAYTHLEVNTPIQRAELPASMPIS